MAKSWYIYLGFGDPLLFSSYARVTAKHSALCGNKISVIYADGESFRPDAPLSSNIQSYIKRALATGQLQPDNPFGAKKFIYLKYVEPKIPEK